MGGVLLKVVQTDDNTNYPIDAVFEISVDGASVPLKPFDGQIDTTGGGGS